MLKYFFFIAILSKSFAVNASQYQQVVHADSSLWYLAHRDLTGEAIDTLFAGEQNGDEIEIWFSSQLFHTFDTLFMGTVKSSSDFAQLWFKQSSELSHVDSPEFILVYDMNLEIGDTFHYPHYSVVVDTVYYLNDLKHIVFNEDVSNWHTRLKFIENVGPNISVVWSFFGYILNPYIICSYHNLNLIYQTSHPMFEDCNFKPTGLVQNSGKTAVSFYPNPTSGSTIINLPEEIYNTSISIYDLQGRKVFTQKLSQNENVLSLDGFVSGVYVVIISQETQVLAREKLVVF